MKHYKIFLIIYLVVLIVSCTKELNIKDAGFEKSFEKVNKKFKNGSYIECIDDLNVMLLNYGGEAGIDSVQYLLAESHFYLEEYYSASYEYSKLTESFPESKLAEESYFKSALCIYNLSPLYSLEQKETYNAISKLQFYLDIYPTGKFAERSNKLIRELREKLAKKEFESGRLYLKMDQPRAAKVYFNEIISNYYDTSFYIPSLKYMAESSKLMDDDYNYRIFIEKYNKSSGHEKK